MLSRLTSFNLNFFNLGRKVGDSDFAHFLEIGLKWKYRLRFNHLYLPLANFCTGNWVGDRKVLAFFVKLFCYFVFLLRNSNCNKLFTESAHEFWIYFYAYFKRMKAKIAEWFNFLKWSVNSTEIFPLNLILFLTFPACF